MNKVQIAGQSFGLGDTLFLLNKQVKIVMIDEKDNAFPVKISGVIEDRDVWMASSALTLNPISEAVIKAANTPLIKYQYLYQLEGYEKFGLTEVSFVTDDEAREYLEPLGKITSLVRLNKSRSDARSTVIPQVTEQKPAARTRVCLSRKPYSGRKGKQSGLPANIFRTSGSDKFHAQIHRAGKCYYSGKHTTVEQAIIARDAILKTFDAPEAPKNVVVQLTTKQQLPKHVYKPRGNSYCVDLSYNGVRHYRGKLKTVDDAVAVRDAILKELHGEQATLTQFEVKPEVVAPTDFQLQVKAAAVGFKPGRASKKSGLPRSVYSAPNKRSYFVQVGSGKNRFYSSGHTSINEAVAVRDSHLASK